MFGSNVQPRKVKYPEKSPWYCHHCDQDVPAYFKKCPSCNKQRKD